MSYLYSEPLIVFHDTLVFSNVRRKYRSDKWKASWFFKEIQKRQTTTRETTATMGSTTCETLGARLKTLVGDDGGKGGKRKPGASGALEETLEVRATTMLIESVFFLI